ncbi:MAG TPA: hypothetical protein VFY57_04220 [Rubrobacteraceae bacterium]|jgi:hypothetical protein|nr:hypothetical protein [Rubrobacteraceae bacterium]
MDGLRRAWPLLFSLPLIVALVAAALLSGCEGSRPSAQEERQHAENQSTGSGGDREQASRGGSELGHPVVGDPGAPVLMVEYGDFQ